MTTEDRESRIATMLLHAAEKIAAECIENNPKDAVLYIERLAKYRDMVNTTNKKE